MANEPEKSDMLIATASLADSNFEKSVVLLCHASTEGAYGLILNRPAEPPPDVVDKWPFLHENLFQGGPVEQDALQVLHAYGDQVEGATQVLDGVWLGGDFEQLQDGLQAGNLNPAYCRFFAGYAGWGADQLQSELESGAWVILPGSARLVFDMPSEQLWSCAIREWGKGDPFFRHYPQDPRWN